MAVATANGTWKAGRFPESKPSAVAPQNANASSSVLAGAGLLAAGRMGLCRSRSAPGRDAPSPSRSPTAMCVAGEAGTRTRRRPLPLGLGRHHVNCLAARAGDQVRTAVAVDIADRQASRVRAWQDHFAALEVDRDASPSSPRRRVTLPSLRSTARSRAPSPSKSPPARSMAPAMPRSWNSTGEKPLLAAPEDADDPSFRLLQLPARSAQDDDVRPAVAR